MKSNDKTSEKFTCVFALRGGYRRISQRIYQRHEKIALKHFILGYVMACWLNMV